MSDRLILSRSNKEEIINLSKFKEDSILFALKENSPISIRFETDKNSILKIDCFYYLEQINGKTIVCENHILELQNKKTYIISNGTVEVGYFPGRYEIQYSKENKDSIRFFFDVKCHDSNSELGLKMMIERLESLIDFLTVDFLHDGKSQYSSKLDNPSAFKRNLELFYPAFKKKVSFLFSNITPDLKTVYVKDKKFGKQDAKSIKLTQRKCVVSDEMFSRKKVFTFDTIKNQSFKKILFELLKYLKDKYSMVNSKIIDIDMDIKNRKDNLSLEKNQRKKEESDIATLEKQLTFFVELGDIILTYIRYIKTILNKLTELNVKNVTYLDKSYRRYADVSLLEKLSKEIENEEREVNVKIQYIRSIQIFEYYGFYIINKLLLNNGYQLIDKNVSSFVDFREDHAKFFYVKDDIKVKVLYGPYCECFYTTTKRDVAVKISSNNDHPDYIVQFFKNDSLLSQVVIEMKYRALDYNYDNTDNEIFKTGIDYLQLGYLDSDGSLLNGTISKVLFFFPSKNKSFVDIRKFKKLYLIGIDLENDGIDDESLSIINDAFMFEKD